MSAYLFVIARCYRPSPFLQLCSFLSLSLYSLYKHPSISAAQPDSTVIRLSNWYVFHLQIVLSSES